MTTKQDKFDEHKLPPVSGMGVAVESVSAAQMALDALDFIFEQSLKPEHKQKSISDEVETIRAALTAAMNNGVPDGYALLPMETEAKGIKFRLLGGHYGTPEHIGMTLNTFADFTAAPAVETPSPDAVTVPCFKFGAELDHFRDHDSDVEDLSKEYPNIWAALQWLSENAGGNYFQNGNNHTAE